MNHTHTFVGLGNPGKEYSQTRHNVGFMAVDLLASMLQLTWKKLPAFGCQTAENTQFLLIKPEKYMNTSGEVVAQYLSYHDKKEWHAHTQTILQHLYVIHDDLDIQLGEYKLQMGVGPKVHNGLSSLYVYLGSRDFWHVRVGIDNRGGSRQTSGSEYVLNQFAPVEYQKVQVVLQQVGQLLLAQTIK